MTAERAGCSRGPLGLDFPATTPLIVARYARIRAGEALATRFAASGEIVYVIASGGESRVDGETLAWEAGDVFCLPGGRGVTHVAGASDALLWIVTNEPQLAFERLERPAPGKVPLPLAPYPAAEIRGQLEAVHALPPAKTMTGKAVTFSNVLLDGQRTCLPSLTLALNSLLPGESQRAHRHNAVAVTLVVRGARCYSMIDGARVDEQPDAVTITPPRDLHSHHNEGDERRSSSPSRTAASTTTAGRWGSATANGVSSRRRPTVSLFGL